MTLFFAIGALFAIQDVQGHSVAHALHDGPEVVDLHFAQEGRRRTDGMEEMTLTLAGADEVVLPLRRIEELAEHGLCASYHDGEFDVVVTGCEGDNRSITIGGHGSWNYEAATGLSRRIEDDDGHCASLEPSEDDHDAMMMKAVAESSDVHDMMQNSNTAEEFEMEIRYYYDETLLAKYNGNHAQAKKAVREMHEHAKVLMRHPTIGRKVHLLFNVEPRLISKRLGAGPKQMITDFRLWLKNQDLCQPQIAFHHVITDHGSDGVWGVARRASVCHDQCFNYGITELVYGNIVTSAQTLAHELGHNLGAYHNHSRINQGRNCKGIMSYGVRPNVWSACTRDMWTEDYDTFLQTFGQARTDRCFRPMGPKPTPRPTRPPTRKPTPKGGCTCSGVRSKSGSGGPECTRGWCYTLKDACTDGRRSSSVPGAEYSFDACEGGKSPVSSPTPKPVPAPTKKPTKRPTPAPVSSGRCRCSGVTSSSGRGGPSCTSGWCYTTVNACADGKKSSSVKNAEWSRDACRGGGSPVSSPTPKPVRAPTPKPVRAPTPKPVRAPTPKPVRAPTPRPVPAPTPSGGCKCSGRTNSRGQGGANCRTRYSKGAWCYTVPNVCSDGRKSTMLSNAEMSYLACKGGVPAPTPRPTPKPVASPASSPSGYKQMPGGGWCMESSGWDKSARYTMPHPTTHAKTKAACDRDSRCIAYVWGEKYRVGMIYSTNNCATDCAYTRWHSNRKLITRSGYDGKKTFWRDAKCNVKN